MAVFDSRFVGCYGTWETGNDQERMVARLVSPGKAAGRCNQTNVLKSIRQLFRIVATRLSRGRRWPRVSAEFTSRARRQAFRCRLPSPLVEDEAETLTWSTADDTMANRQYCTSDSGNSEHDILVPPATPSKHLFKTIRVTLSYDIKPPLAGHLYAPAPTNSSTHTSGPRRLPYNERLLWVAFQGRSAFGAN